MRVAVGMSGGVDSSVSALLLKMAGHEVIGVTLRFHTIPESCSTDDLRVCCSPEDVKDAAKVSEKLGIPHITFDWERIFKERVIDYFVQEYAEGKTPNPCAICNRDVKTGFLARYLREVAQVDRLATGHYARLVEYKGKRLIARAKDKSKDQSYFLALVRKKDLELLEFPLGDLTKEQVRRIAVEYSLPVAQKRDSQEVCFLMGKKPGEFIKERVGEASGYIKHVSGRVLGTHTGIYNFTIGQRRGLGVSYHEPLYVVDIDAQTNTVIVGSEELIYKSSLKLKDINFHLHIDKWGKDVYAVVRYRTQAVKVKDIKETKDGFVVEFETPVRGITPGQVCAFYEGDVLLGGGIIAQV
ncbi:tRNA(5-methylaminomethyl-2-thiouridylate)-methyl transferase [Hydrogenobacter thermophilus TK-6]|uniref:tRNA-specific 2-thiouridylase MnmA n=1 Tax=Hydrogenobacter thermophilus (strain DSM 6534 / IAM 12695 / TK-6) TaxID=608538 RepID=D3DJ56_HYDTT|nr:tRNA 2-thiouridine(34) synthase MnmA [Hydrogenobacter thermophilus]ADO45781.1 tRNA(5-methylaminomethyl-2-thiouridylate)-methyl transferase [Hydrogenobacter thermophilus TK-6]BAI69858.1 tRNA (5-methylaminomethyl-2-thiouridylate)-methyltransferase [Hydrogenobacter thermophilus TK-6]